jgi:hypothetical protein
MFVVGLSVASSFRMTWCKFAQVCIYCAHHSNALLCAGFVSQFRELEPAKYGIPFCIGRTYRDTAETTPSLSYSVAKWEMESCFDIGNGSRLRKLSICNRSMGSSFEASKSRLEIVSSVLEGEANLCIALATFPLRA